MQRRLAAIVHADLAGFTRMMEGAETRTFRHLKSAQIEVWRPAIEASQGRLVGTAGDAMLAEFGSAVTAVGAAIDIQERMARFNEALQADQRMMFRIGVHLGEVIIDDEDQNIFGDGVNLAARIQALAEPGGIAVSRAVRDLVELQGRVRLRRRRRAAAEEREPLPSRSSMCATPGRRRSARRPGWCRRSRCASKGPIRPAASMPSTSPSTS